MVMRKRIRAITGGMVIALRDNIAPKSNFFCGMNTPAREPKRIELETRKPKAEQYPLSMDKPS